MKKGRILIVDDQEEILESLGAVLMDEGHEVILARDGQDALHSVQSDAPHIVFLDIWIPGIDGMQTLKAIKRIDPKCFVIMMSGHGTIETAVKAIKLGAEDYLEKPLNLEDVLHLVDKAILEREKAAQAQDLVGNYPGPLIGESFAIRSLRRSIEKAGQEKGSVWLVGDKGSGKEFIARVVHFLAGKDRTRLVKVYCNELTENNIDEVLFGKTFGGALTRQGKISLAEGGALLFVRIDRLKKTVFKRLEEIIDNQVMAQNVAPLSRKAAIRLLCTSDSYPDDLIKKVGFPIQLAKNLSHRIIYTPSLSQRPEDIPLAVEYFLKEASEEFDRNISGIEEEAMDRLVSYSWPGNVKELKILMEHIVMTAPGPKITLKDLLLPTGVDGLFEVNRVEQSDISNSASSSYISISEQFGSNAGSEQHLNPEAGYESPFRRQKTLRGRVVMYGLGLHSGVKTGLTISPLPASSGILFGHITSGGTVPALLQNVESTDYSTSLRNSEALAKTIEHLMAVFHVYGLTNLLVKISGEVPIMDGSALEFCRMVENAEIINQDGLVEEIRIQEPIKVRMPEGSPKSMTIEPSDCFEVEYHLNYPEPIGKMKMDFRLENPLSFKNEIAPARTFGFVKDMRMMDEMGLAGGGKLSNVVLLDEEKVVNPPLRFEDEFVRHKILDILGDFYLLGRPIIGKIVAVQTGHSDNISMLRTISKEFCE